MAFTTLPNSFADRMTINLSIVHADGTLNLNDHVSYALAAEGTRDQVSRTFNQIKATSPALAGEYIVHSVPGMVVESLAVYCIGTTQALMQARYRALLDAFEHWTYQLNWQWADYTEKWTCNAVQGSSADMSHVMLHNYMAKVSLQVPRFPTITTP